jgi:hypothetical protein
MNPRPSSDFQNGIIELFKVHKTYDLNIIDCQKKGDVTCEIVYNKIYLILNNIILI